VSGTADGAKDAAGGSQRSTLAELFALEAGATGNRFRGPGRPTVRPRAYGGLTAAQAVVAAGRTVAPERLPHSLHVTFLRAADPAEPIDLAVEPVREGRAFSARRVIARQAGRDLLEAHVSFHAAAEGPEHEPPPPPVPGPEHARTVDSWLADASDDVQTWASAFLLYHPLDVRFVDDPPPIAVRHGPRTGPSRYWARPTAAMPDDPLLRAATLTYGSDLLLLTAALLRHGRSITADIAAISLDHALWFHREPVGDWLLFAVTSPSASGGRVLARADVRDETGHLVASVVQEGVLRLDGGGR
jgi:acyl-CoA thioesterase II